MFSFKDALFNALKANTALAALLAPENIWSQFAPSGGAPVTAPWVAIKLVSGTELSAHNGNNNLGTRRFQVTVGGTDETKAAAIVDILTSQFNGVSYDYTDPANVHHDITIFVGGVNDKWEEATRTQSPSVDLLLSANY